MGCGITEGSFGNFSAGDKPNFTTVLISSFQSHSYLTGVTPCYRSSRAVAPVKYERDMQEATNGLMLTKNGENYGTEKNVE